MTDEHLERLAVAFEKIASALEGINESGRSGISKLWPESAGQREVIVTRAESEEERVLKEQGKKIPKSDVNQWLAEDFGGESDPEDDDESIGEREREWRQRIKAARKFKLEHAASADADQVSGQASGGPETDQGEAGTGGEGPEHILPTEAS